MEMGRKVLFFGCIVFLCGYSQYAECCCMSGPKEISPCEAESYSLIVEARVIGLEYLDPLIHENPNMDFESDVRVTVSVDRSWLGSVPERVELWTHSVVLAGGYPFLIGRRYLIFVGKGSEAVFQCSRTRRSEDAVDLEFQLNEMFGEALAISPDG